MKLDVIFEWDWPVTTLVVNPDNRFENINVPDVCPENLEFLADKISEVIAALNDLEANINESI